LFHKLLFLLLPVLVIASDYPQPKSFTHAVKIFKQIDMSNKHTFFTNKEYDYDPATCMRNLYLKDNHEVDVVFSRIVPEDMMVKDLSCYKEDICTDMMGKIYHGKRCCRKIDKVYKAYEKDIFNIIAVEKGSIYSHENPPNRVKGNIARVYLYMQLHHQLKLTKAQVKRYKQWNKEDAVDENECALYKQIFKIQGRENPWIKSACETLESKSSK